MVTENPYVTVEVVKETAAWIKAHQKKRDIYGTEKRLSLLINTLETFQKDRRLLFSHSDSPQDLIKVYEVLDETFQKTIKAETDRLHSLLQDL